MLTCSCHAIYIKQRHLGAGVSHYRRCDTQSDNVTGLACAMESVRQMSQVWHVVRQMSQVWHVSWRLCVRCHGVRASDVMSRNVKTASPRRLCMRCESLSNLLHGRRKKYALLTPCLLCVHTGPGESVKVAESH